MTQTDTSMLLRVEVCVKGRERVTGRWLYVCVEVYIHTTSVCVYIYI